jgi:hypothetical protein
MQTFTTREQIIEIVNRLFVYTDYREWQKLQTEVFTPTVRFDMSSLGAGTPKDLPAQEICAMWESGFAGIDAVHHHSGNFLVTVNGGAATVFCYATASHYKAAATQGHTREFVGSYDLGLQQTISGWRINSFRYNVKYTGGNMELQ